MLTFRAVNTEADRSALLELHCQGNFESESPWARTVPYEQYREKWLSTSQPESFIAHLRETMKDERTIAEIVEDDGDIAGYVWVTFSDIPDYDLSIANVNDIAVAPHHRRRGIASQLMDRIDKLARERGASVLRSETGIENVVSQRLHEKVGFRTYKILYEKTLFGKRA